jgi:hypothetical protein
VSVYVDGLTKWPTKIRCFKPGSCHLIADTLPELHAFAAKLGLKAEWFQDHPVEPHYDLTVEKRAKAVALGAIETTWREFRKRKPRVTT